MLKLVAKSPETAQVPLETDLVKLKFKQTEMQLPEMSFAKEKWKVAVDLGKKSHATLNGVIQRGFWTAVCKITTRRR